MKIAILTFDGFNEIDSFVASFMINRVSRPGWKAEITCPTPVVESGRGVRVHAQQTLEFASEADAVLVGSGALTGRLVEDWSDDVSPGARPAATAGRLAVLGCAGPGEARNAGDLAGLHRPRNAPAARVGGSPGPGTAVLRSRERGHRGWLPVVALPRDLVPLASGRSRRGGGGARLRRPRRAGVRVRVPGDGRGRGVHGRAAVESDLSQVCQRRGNLGVGERAVVYRRDGARLRGLEVLPWLDRYPGLVAPRSNTAP